MCYHLQHLETYVRNCTNDNLCTFVTLLYKFERYSRVVSVRSFGSNVRSTFDLLFVFYNFQSLANAAKRCLNFPLNFGEREMSVLRSEKLIERRKNLRIRNIYKLIRDSKGVHANKMCRFSELQHAVGGVMEVELKIADG